MNTISAIGKWLDQPILVKEFSRAVPTILVGGGAIYTYNHVKNTPRENKKKELIKSVIVLSTTIFAALIAPKASSKIIKRFSKESSCGHCSCGHEHGHGAATGLKELKEEMKQKVEDFLKSNKDLKDNPELKKIKEGGILNISGIKKLFKKMEARPGGKEFLSGEDGLIPNPENIDSKHIFDEITRISVLGLFPVLGGIAGGIAGDRMTEKNWKDKIPNKIKEGSFQYLANIFLCNIGAGASLAIMEKFNVESKPVRVLGMVGGIILTGLIFGSAVANLIGKKIINPIFADKDYGRHHNLHLYSERKPEALDAGLHIDDIAPVAVMSGLKWIEPALPILYSISGYRAGIGYRNGEHHKEK